MPPGIGIKSNGEKNKRDGGGRGQGHQGQRGQRGQHDELGQNDQQGHHDQRGQRKGTKRKAADIMDSNNATPNSAINLEGRKVNSYIDGEGNEVWICPSCKKKEWFVESDWIACDICNFWYHWKCQGIDEEPPTDQDWYWRRIFHKDPALVSI